MKRYIKLLFIMVIALILVFCGKSNMEKIDKKLEKKYSDNSDYKIIRKEENKNYIAYLGHDKERIYLDIFKDNDFFGGSDMKIEQIILRDLISNYSFSQEETLIIVWGKNKDLNYKSYKWTTDKVEDFNTQMETDIGRDNRVITKEIDNEEYILDIYIMESYYNIPGDLELLE